MDFNKIDINIFPSLKKNVCTGNEDNNEVRRFI